MITKLQYVAFLLSTMTNFTGTHLAEHLDGVSHDTITDFLQSERLTARHWSSANTAAQNTVWCAGSAS